MMKDIAKLGVVAALIGVAPLAFAQAVSTTSNAIVPTASYTGSSGTTGTAGASSPSAVSTMSSTSGSTTPGVPNTGAGGDASANLALLVASGAIVLAGVGYLVSRRGGVRA